MPDTPSNILDREEAKSHAAEHFSPQIELLRDLANYGSNLVLRAYNSSAKDIAAIVTCGVLLKQIVAMLDATHALVESGMVHAAHLPARAAFEASIYLDWILLRDSEHKARCYLVSNYRDERVWALRAIKGTPEETIFKATAESIGLDIHAQRPTLASDAKRQLDQVNRILGQAEFAPIDQEFNKVKGKRKVDPEWYELSGAKSIRQVAKAVGRLAEYEFFYSKGSQVSHTASYKDHIRFVQQQVHFKPIRNLEGINTVLNFVVSTAIHAFQHVVKVYRPTEMPAFQRKYIEDWRTPFLTVRGVTYDYKEKG